jgi:hypothetical protein
MISNISENFNYIFANNKPPFTLLLELHYLSNPRENGICPKGLISQPGANVIKLFLSGTYEFS